METKFDKTEYKNLAKPDNSRTFNNGLVETIDIGSGTVGRITLQPGWRWSSDIKPVAKTEWCECAHFQYQLSGRLHVKMSDGMEFELGPGDVSYLKPGHDAWVIGDEPVVVIDWLGTTNYAKEGITEQIAKAA